jgi:hypothetical protein
LVFRRFVTSFEKANDVGGRWPSLALVFLGWWHTERLATILLRQPQEPPIISPPAIEALHDENSSATECGDFRRRDRKTKRCQI